MLTQLPFTGTATAVGTVGGRVVTTLDTNLPATHWVLYPSSGGLLMLETDSLNLTIGAAYAQTESNPGGFSRLRIESQRVQHYRRR